MLLGLALSSITFHTSVSVVLIFLTLFLVFIIAYHHLVTSIKVVKILKTYLSSLVNHRLASELLSLMPVYNIIVFELLPNFAEVKKIFNDPVIRLFVFG
jgi:hypothetical protein